MRLYHFSEDPDIARFDPQVPAAQPAAPPLVWAIDEEHAPHYLFPRDCPRVCFWVGPGTTPADRERFFGHTRAREVIAVETSWLERVRGATLYEYEMPPATFAVQDASAGYYVSTEAVSPIKVERVDDPLMWLAASGIELRITPSLWPLRDALVPSTVRFSMIRMHNATPKR